MVWVKIDDHFDEHPKIAAVGPLGIALWLTGLAYCNRNQTNGKIPATIALRLLSFEFPHPTDGDDCTILVGGERSADEEQIGFVPDRYFIPNMLVAAGLWEEIPGGYLVHDYTDYQPTKEELAAEREQKRAAGKAGGQASAQARAKAGAQAKSNPVPVPVPDPVIPFRKPEPREAAAAAHAPEGLDAVQSAWREAGHEVTPAVTRMMVQDIEAMPLDWVLAAIDEGVQCGARGWKYIRSILERWKHEGREVAGDVWAKNARQIAAINALREANG